MKFPPYQRQLSFALTKAEKRRVDDGILPVELFRFLPADDTGRESEERKREAEEDEGTSERRSRGGSRKGNRAGSIKSRKEAAVAEGAEGGRESTTAPSVADDESGSILVYSDEPLGGQRSTRRAGERRSPFVSHRWIITRSSAYILPGFSVFHIYTYIRLSGFPCPVYIYNRAICGRNAIVYMSRRSSYLGRLCRNVSTAMVDIL